MRISIILFKFWTQNCINNEILKLFLCKQLPRRAKFESAGGITAPHSNSPLCLHCIKPLAICEWMGIYAAANINIWMRYERERLLLIMIIIESWVNKREPRLHQDNNAPAAKCMSCRDETEKASVWWWGGGAAGGESTTISLIATWLALQALCYFYSRAKLEGGKLGTWLRFVCCTVSLRNDCVLHSCRYITI